MICCACCGEPVAVILGETFVEDKHGGIICKTCDQAERISELEAELKDVMANVAARYESHNAETLARQNRELLAKVAQLEQLNRDASVAHSLLAEKIEEERTKRVDAEAQAAVMRRFLQKIVREWDGVKLSDYVPVDMAFFLTQLREVLAGDAGKELLAKVERMKKALRAIAAGGQDAIGCMEIARGTLAECSPAQS